MYIHEMSYTPQTTQAKLLRLYMHLYKVSLKLKNLSKFKKLSKKTSICQIALHVYLSQILGG